MTQNKQTKLLTVVAVLIAISVGFYYGLSDDRTAAVNPDFGSFTTTEYTGDLIGSWSLGANVLSPSRFSGMGYSWQRNDTGWLYMMGGDINGSGSNTNRNERYNLRTNSWTVMAPMLGVLQYSGAAKLKDSLYTVGGMPTSFFTSAINNLRRYDINANSWVERAPMPAVNGWCEAVGYQDSLIYALGGLTSGGNLAGPQVYLYNAVNNTWRTATSLPAARTGGAAAIKGDTIIYVGGNTGYFTTPVFTVYKGLISQSNRSVITWSTGLDKPGTTRWRFDAHDWGCKGIIVDPGGNTGFGVSTEVYVYSPGLNTWTAQPNCQYPTSTAHSGSFALSNDLYKLVVASGLILSPPYSIPQNQIFTDSFSCGPLQACIGTGTTTGAWPFNTFWHDSRTQMLWTSTEMANLDRVDQVAFNVSSFATQVMNGFNIRMQNTTLTTLTGWVTSGWTTVYTGTYQVAGTGWQTINLQNGFTRNTADNLLVEICFDNTSYTSATNVYNTSTPTGMTREYHQDNGAGCSLTNSTAVSRPNICFYKITGVERDPTVIPNEYSLAQNYPNPFNPSTSISFALPKADNVKLVVYDVLGREVRTLVNEFRQAGIHKVQFDASGFSSGVYFYRLETKDFTDTKKMLLVK